MFTRSTAINKQVIKVNNNYESNTKFKCGPEVVTLWKYLLASQCLANTDKLLHMKKKMWGKLQGKYYRQGST